VSARPPVTAYVALGGNLGDPVHALAEAVARIAQLPGTTVTRRSSLYRTAPIDSTGPDYINAVAEISTNLSAPELLERLQAIETAAGRERPCRNAPRTLDLDLLLYGSARIDSPSLQVPHPRMNERAFVLAPLAEIAPQLVPQALLDNLTSQVIERMTP
jgi:2-amino-4-hydroxy-6-hydroxymethyldihydropteridine diphosphokinase